MTKTSHWYGKWWVKALAAEMFWVHSSDNTIDYLARLDVFIWIKLGKAAQSYKTMKHLRLEVTVLYQLCLNWERLSHYYLLLLRVLSKHSCNFYISIYISTMTGLCLHLYSKCASVFSKANTAKLWDSLQPLLIYFYTTKGDELHIQDAFIIPPLCLSLRLSLSHAHTLSLLLKSVGIFVPIKWIIPITLSDNSALSVRNPI